MFDPLFHHVRKNLMEAELVRSKKDMMCLNNQLLEAIQRKLELSQELEAWQVGLHGLFVCLCFYHPPSLSVCLLLSFCLCVSLYLSLFLSLPLPLFHTPVTD